MDCFFIDTNGFIINHWTYSIGDKMRSKSILLIIAVVVGIIAFAVREFGANIEYAIS